MILKRRILGVCVVLALGVIPSFADVYDATANFPTITSASQNPASANGVWSYGYATTLSPVNFALYPSSTSDYFALDGMPDGHAAGFYTTSSGSPLPTVINNISGGTLVKEDGTIGPWPNTVLLMHPGPNGEYSVVQFTAPSTATYSVTGTFYQIGNNYGGNGATIDSVIGPGGVSLFSTVSTSSSNAFGFNEHLVAGQSVDFAVGLGPDDQFSFDSTAFNADISATPEPAFYGVLALGLTVLVVAARRRKTA